MEVFTKNRNDLEDDLTQLYHLNDLSVFHDIKERFRNDLIYVCFFPFLEILIFRLIMVNHI